MNEFNVQIKYRRKIRRVTLRVLPGKVIRVTAPHRLPQKDIKDFILRSKEWILKQHQFIEEKPPERHFEFKSEEKFTYCGQIYELKLIEGTHAITLQENFLILSVPKKYLSDKKYIERKLIRWYKMQAITKIHERVAHFTKLIGVKEKSVSIKNYKSRWGCCSSKGDLIFNWQIITFDSDLFDYVVAHEVSHLKEMNHSVRFYYWLSQLGFEKNKYNALMRSARNIFSRD